MFEAENNLGGLASDVFQQCVLCCRPMPSWHGEDTVHTVYLTSTNVRERCWGLEQP